MPRPQRRHKRPRQPWPRCRRRPHCLLRLQPLLSCRPCCIPTGGASGWCTTHHPVYAQPSNDIMQIGYFAFERLDTAGNPSNLTEGSRWAQFYPYIHPKDASGSLFWNSLPCSRRRRARGSTARSGPKMAAALDFWTPQEGSTEFRVLYDGAEIGRCTISAGECEVFAP